MDKIERKIIDSLKTGTPEKTRGCVSELQLSAYIDCSLSAVDKNTVENHIKNCDYCLHSIQKIKDISVMERETDFVKVPKHLKEKVKSKTLSLQKTFEIVIEFTKEKLQVISDVVSGLNYVYQPVPVRNGSQKTPTSVEFEKEVQDFIFKFKITKISGQDEIKGTITVLKESKPVENLKLELINNNRKIMITATDNNGAIDIDSLGYGDYELYIPDKDINFDISITE